MRRADDWDQQLVAYIEAKRAAPFVWGKRANDCCSFANGAVMATTGEDLMADIADYDSEFGAGRALVAAGVDSFAELVAVRLPEIPVGEAQRGDLALASKANEIVLTVVEGEFLIGPDLEGLVRLPRWLAMRAWRVG